MTVQVRSPEEAVTAASSDSPPRPAPSRSHRRWRFALAMAVLGIALVAVIAVSGAVGQFAVSPMEVLASIGRKVGLPLAPPPDHTFLDAALWSVRFPRIMLGLLVGAGLGVAGTAMQGVFRNPLAEPGIIGVSAGCAVGACVVIVLHLEFLGVATVPVAAFVCGLVTTLLVYFFAMSQGRTHVLALVLTGIAVNAVANAAVAYLVFLADTSSREQVMFWQLGSLAGATWPSVWAIAPFFIAGLIGVSLMAGKLDVLALGERSARHLGVNVERVRLWSIVCVALLAASAVVFAGIISFVGLVIPHLLRLVVGPSHRMLIPASALGGALLIALSDVVARTAISFTDLPIGMFTALVGGPVFFYLLRRTMSGGKVHS